MEEQIKELLKHTNNLKELLDNQQVGMFIWEKLVYTELQWFKEYTKDV